MCRGVAGRRSSSTTVSDLETLTTGMSRKIWQKISLLPREAVRPVADYALPSSP